MPARRVFEGSDACPKRSGLAVCPAAPYTECPPSTPPGTSCAHDAARGRAGRRLGTLLRRSFWARDCGVPLGRAIQARRASQARLARRARKGKCPKTCFIVPAATSATAEKACFERCGPKTCFVVPAATTSATAQRLARARLSCGQSVFVLAHTVPQGACAPCPMRAQPQRARRVPCRSVHPASPQAHRWEFLVATMPPGRRARSRLGALLCPCPFVVQRRASHARQVRHVRKGKCVEKRPASARRRQMCWVSLLLRRRRRGYRVRLFRGGSRPLAKFARPGANLHWGARRVPQLRAPLPEIAAAHAGRASPQKAQEGCRGVKSSRRASDLHGCLSRRQRSWPCARGTESGV